MKRMLCLLSLWRGTKGLTVNLKKGLPSLQQPRRRNEGDAAIDDDDLEIPLTC